jgi:hypothetical protein
MGIGLERESMTGLSSGLTIQNVLLITAFLAISMPLFSQENSVWFQTGAQWHYRFGEGMDTPNSGYEKLQVVGDTLIEDHIYRTISRLRVHSGGDSIILDTLKLRHDPSNDRVFRYLDSMETLLYDFSAKEKDTIIVQAEDWNGGIGYCHLFIDSIRIEVFSDSVHRRIQYCTEINNYRFYFAGKIIEGIGSEVFILPVDQLMCDAGCANKLRCYSDSLMNITNPNIGCDELFHYNIVEKSFSIHSRIFPNPADRMIYVESDISLSSIMIYDQGGRKILNMLCDGGLNTRIDLTAICPGMYIIQIGYFNGETEVQSLFIE